MFLQMNQRLPFRELTYGHWVYITFKEKDVSIFLQY